MKIFHDIVFAASDDGDDTPIISDAYKGDFDIANDAGDKEFALMYSIQGTVKYYDSAEGDLISPEQYEEKEPDAKADCSMTYVNLKKRTREHYTKQTLFFFAQLRYRPSVHVGGTRNFVCCIQQTNQALHEGVHEDPSQGTHQESHQNEREKIRRQKGGRLLLQLLQEECR